MIDGHDDLPMNGPDIQINSSFWSHLTTFLPFFSNSQLPGLQVSRHPQQQSIFKVKMNILQAIFPKKMDTCYSR